MINTILCIIISLLHDVMAAPINHPHGDCLLRLLGLAQTHLVVDVGPYA
jgi:hypothetical protein